MFNIPVLFGLDPGIILWIIIGVIMVINAIASQFKERPGKPRQRQRRRVTPTGQTQVGRPAQSPDALRGEIDEFLKRAANPMTTVERPPQPPATLAPPKSPAFPGQRKPSLPPVQATVVKPTAEDVTEHVRKHIESGSIAQRHNTPSAAVSEADEHMESHLHEVFDHKLGNLQDTSQEKQISEGTDATVWKARQPVDKNRLAKEIAAMFESPTDVRRAVILSEIISRPEERW